MMICANQDGVFDANLITGETFLSPQWKAMLGYGADELASTPKTWQRFMHPEDKSAAKAALNEYLRSGEGVCELEYRLRHKDGSWRWILARGQAVWDQDGRAIRLVGSHSDITERKHAMDELKTSEARFSAFMQHNPCHAFIKGADGRLAYMNRTVEKLWGLQPGEWIGKRVEDLRPVEIAERFRQMDAALQSSDAPCEFLAKIETPEGNRWFLTTSFTFPEASGTRSCGGIAVDITERVEAEEKLRASELRYHELFDRNPLPSLVYSKEDSQILDVNQAAIRHYGWSRSEFLSKSVRSLLVPGEEEAAEAEIKQSSLDNRCSKPIRHRRNNKSDIWVEITSYDIELPGYSACRATANDITARIAAENELKQAREELEMLVAQRTAELQASEAKWRELVEALPQFVWSTRVDGAVDYISNQWATYTGIPVSELLGSGWIETLHPSDQERVKLRRIAARAQEEGYDLEYRIRGRDGYYRWFVARARPVRSGEGGPVTGWLGTSTDIEDQKRSEERLESAVAERTLALAEALDRAECAAKAKSSFLAAMSHEIRTPMNAVIGMTELMMDGPLAPGQRSQLDTIRSSGQALLAIINDILDFSKIEAGKMELDCLEFDLQTLLEESMELVTASARAKDLHMSLQVDDQAPFTVIGDPGRLRQILLNLLSNAVKFTERGSVSLSVVRLESDQASDQSRTLRFEVRDTGIGMSPEQESTIFQAFTQADRSTTRRFGGTGLGLSIAKRLVELMAGTIGVSSKIGEGTTFWFQIALASGTTLEPGLFAGRRILLIDGGNPDRAVVAHYLQRAGMQVEGLPVESVPRSSHDGSALNGFADAGIPFALIIVDAGQLSRAPSIVLQGFGSIPVIALGSSSDPRIAACVPDPVRSVPLLQAVQSVLRGESLHALGEASRSKNKATQGAEILVVEDNRVNQMVATLLLQKLGCRVQVAINGAEACRALEARSFDLVLMDCQMPEMDGFEATRRIRSRESGARRTPIIALTAGVLKEERDKCYEAGMDGFLSKPISNEELKAALESWLAATRAHVPPATTQAETNPLTSTPLSQT